MAIASAGEPEAVSAAVGHGPVIVVGMDIMAVDCLHRIDEKRIHRQAVIPIRVRLDQEGACLPGHGRKLDDAHGDHFRRSGQQFLRETVEKVVVAAAPEPELCTVVDPQGCALRGPADLAVALQEGLERPLPCHIDPCVAEGIRVEMVRHGNGGEAGLEIAIHQFLRGQDTAGTDHRGMQMGLDLIAHGVAPSLSGRNW